MAGIDAGRINKRNTESLLCEKPMLWTNFMFSGISGQHGISSFICLDAPTRQRGQRNNFNRIVMRKENKGVLSLAKIGYVCRKKYFSDSLWINLTL